MTTGGKIKLEEGTGNGTMVGFKAPDTEVTDECIWTLPSTDGIDGQALVTDGAKGLSWGNGVSSSGALEGQMLIADGNGGASWQWGMVSLNLDLNGCSGTIPANRTGSTVQWFGKNGGQPPTYPPWVPTAISGKIFKGWTKNQDGSGTVYRSFDPVLLITQPTTLYAQCVDGYTLTYAANKPEGASDPTGTLAVDNGVYNTSSFYSHPLNAQEPGIQIEGYTFLNWNTAADGSGTTWEVPFPITTVTSDLVLYAIWKKLYQVTYDINGATGGGDAPIDTNYYNNNDPFVTVGDVRVFTKDGYIAEVWNTQPDGSGEDYANQVGYSFPPSLTVDLKLYVKWMPI